jgi:glycogen debranching enzyme
VFDWYLVDATVFSPDGVAEHSTVFECAPASYNALYAHAAAELAGLTGDAAWRDRATRLAATIDELLWDEAQGLWVDAPLLGGGDTARTPTLDGILGALVTADAARATRALDQVLDPARFAAPYGLAFVARDHPAYDADGYWRGTAWMQMNYLAALAARRWGRTDLAEAVASMSRAAVEHSQFAEHWNPETGQGHGAIPLTWSALVTTFEERP